jgi:hypothetical protein
LANQNRFFVPVVEDSKAEGFNICVAFWDHAATEMKQKASFFFSLNQYLNQTLVEASGSQCTLVVHSVENLVEHQSS